MSTPIRLRQDWIRWRTRSLLLRFRQLHGKNRIAHTSMTADDSSNLGRLSGHFQALMTNPFVGAADLDTLAGEPMRVRCFADTGKRITRRVRARERM